MFIRGVLFYRRRSGPRLETQSVCVRRTAGRLSNTVKHTEFAHAVPSQTGLLLGRTAQPLQTRSVTVRTEIGIKLFNENLHKTNQSALVVTRPTRSEKDKKPVQSRSCNATRVQHDLHTSGTTRYVVLGTRDARFECGGRIIVVFIVPFRAL